MEPPAEFTPQAISSSGRRGLDTRAKLGSQRRFRTVVDSRVLPASQLREQLERGRHDALGRDQAHTDRGFAAAATGATGHGVPDDTIRCLRIGCILDGIGGTENLNDRGSRKRSDVKRTAVTPDEQIRIRHEGRKVREGRRRGGVLRSTLRRGDDRFGSGPLASGRSTRHQATQSSLLRQ